MNTPNMNTPQQDTAATVSPHLPYMEDLKTNLASLVETTASHRIQFEDSIKTCNGAIVIMDEAIKHATSALDVTNKLLSDIEDLNRKALISVITITELKDDITKFSFRAVDLSKDHEASIYDAWTAWRDAVTAVIRAGWAHACYEEVMDKIKQKEEASTDDGHTRYIKSVGFRLCLGGRDVRRELEAAIMAVRAVIATGPRTFGAGEDAYNAVERRVAGALVSARGAVEQMQSGQ